ncbi:hypothetical protein MKX01_035425 [Papaver californicum]|nr:hypothetical protein MKX01_035425 [Papaver californicum]
MIARISNSIELSKLQRCSFINCMNGEAKRNARPKNKIYAENLFYRLKNPHKNQKDDPNLKHPHDWYKYGEYGPYSWRGIVVGDPVRARLWEEGVTLIQEVNSHEEWEEIEKFDKATEFSERLTVLDKKIGFQHYWVFVRHPKWRVTEFPWQQWTLKRLDKWNLMGRLGNKTRSLITQCAAWMRPDIIYVKRPVNQCRFEPQMNFMFELRHDDGRVEVCTYFGGLCKIVRVNPKAFVDDFVNAYEKMSDERKDKCLEFLLSNHPTELLHPYTKEWKAKLEEIELGCDAPYEDEDNNRVDESH